jgi:hypothetical protein
VHFGFPALDDPPVTRTLTILNPGAFELQLGVPSLPPGYELTQPPPATIDAGSSGTMTLAFAATAMRGHYYGPFSIPTNDFDNNPYNFELRASVGDPAPGGPMSGLLNYLLGYTNDAAGLDANGDTVVDIGDLVTRINELTPTTPTLRLPIDGASGLSPTPTPR